MLDIYDDVLTVVLPSSTAATDTNQSTPSVSSNIISTTNDGFPDQQLNQRSDHVDNDDSYNYEDEANSTPSIKISNLQWVCVKDNLDDDI